MTFQEMINALKVDAEYLRDKEVCDAKEIDMAIRLLKGEVRWRQLRLNIIQTRLKS